MRGKKEVLLRLNQKRGQIWIETVVYTLIAFVLIGLVLAFVKPKIEEIQDKSIIEQSISVLEDIDLIIKTLGAPGNQRVIDLGINKGTLNIDAENDLLFFEIESRYIYSEPGENVRIGNILILTEERGKFNDVTLTSDYGEEYNITYQNKDELKTISKSPTPHTLIIANKGDDALGRTIVNIEVII